jgi:hypothetical protein
MRDRTGSSGVRGDLATLMSLRARQSPIGWLAHGSMGENFSGQNFPEQ